MKVQELMSKNPQVCRDDEKLATAVRIMWEHDCGSVPVVDAQGNLAGIVTDRDACMAGYTRGQRLDEIIVRSAMALQPVTCRAEDPVEIAEATMQKSQVRRLPVVDLKGRLVGILSSNDLLRTAVGNQGRAIAAVATLAAIGAPRRLATTKAAMPAPMPAQAASSQATSSLATPTRTSPVEAVPAPKGVPHGAPQASTLLSSLMQAPKATPAAPAPAPKPTASAAGGPGPARGGKPKGKRK